MKVAQFEVSLRVFAERVADDICVHVVAALPAPSLFHSRAAPVDLTIARIHPKGAAAFLVEDTETGLLPVVCDLIRKDLLTFFEALDLSAPEKS